jgi:hypothetical protein
MWRIRRFELSRYWDEILEDVSTVEQALARIKELCSGYQSTEGEGIFFSLEDSQGNTLRLGCSNEGWAAMYDSTDGSGGIAVGNKNASIKGFSAQNGLTLKESICSLRV